MNQVDLQVWTQYR